MGAAVPVLARWGSLEAECVVAARHLRACSPEMIDAMSIAFDDAWRTLVETGSSFATDDQAKVTREVLALRLIDTARTGESDPVRLKDDVLKYLASANVRFLW
jgi:hypothetical protein